MAQVVNNLGHRSAVRQGGNSYIGEALIGFFNRFQEYLERSRTRSHLYTMPDYMLHDIGISRAEVEAEFQKPFWKA